MYDLVIQNGRIIDGTGSAPYFADIAVQDGKIVEIGQGIAGGRRSINAAGLTVTPGFIDSHSHSDQVLLDAPEQTDKLEQGITTSVAGQCGGSVVPNSDSFPTMGAFADAAGKIPLGANIVLFVGHNTLRRTVMGSEDRAPTADELEQMKTLLRDALAQGACGLSFGLLYSPGCYAGTHELMELAKVAGEYGVPISAHIRDEGDHLLEAVEEFISVVKASGTRGVISHHKAMGKANWGKVRQTLKMLDAAVADGIDIYCDVYPYCASSTSLSARFIPKEYRSGTWEDLARTLSDPENRKKIRQRELAIWGEDLSWVLISDCKAYPQYTGLRLPEAAKLHGKDAYETVFDMIGHSAGSCKGFFFTMCEEDVQTVLAYPRAMVGTDGIVRRSQIHHPRLRGTFPRVLGRYVRQTGITDLPEMIRRITSLPAYVYGLRTKGRLAVGFDADLCIFDAEKIIDRADYTDCSKRAEGLHYVLVGGQLAAQNAVFTGNRAGKVLLRTQ